MRLYHGGLAAVAEPRILPAVPGRTLDFGAEAQKKKEAEDGH
jgi:hypothetical protein